MKHWYNNSIIEIQLDEELDIPAGFSAGRLPCSDLCRLNMSKSRKGKPSNKKGSKISDNIKQKISDTLKKRYLTSTHHCKGKHPWNYGLKGAQKAWNKGLSYEQSHKKSKQSMVESINSTKRKNNSFNRSIAENNFFEVLKKSYGDAAIIHHYNSDEYPFNCDFYIKPENLYIELNLHWTHGGKPYDPNDEECQKQLSIWQEKAKTSQFYQNAIQTWTVRDVEKQRIARENKLNYIVAYDEYSVLEKVQRLSKV